MAQITSKKTIFFVTSPRTPFKMIEEIRLLTNNYAGQKWDKRVQTSFAYDLSRADFFNGRINKHLDLAARDRITRAPKALGFVDLKPAIQLTKTGNLLLNSRRPHEIFLRQLLKFQLPSPFHIDKENTFFVKPYLELLRLIYEIDRLSKDEIAIFFMQLIHINKYNAIKNKILSFRHKVKNIDHKKTSYKRLVNETYKFELSNLFDKEIAAGNISTRESETKTTLEFLNKKKRNFKDYADAAVRYLRITTLISIHPRTYATYISKDKIKEVEYILTNTPRKPKKVITQNQFKDYLFNPQLPELLVDNKDAIISLIHAYNPHLDIRSLKTKNLETLKDLRDNLIQEKTDKQVSQQTNQLQTYEEYYHIIETFDDITHKRAVDPSLIMEWNT